MSTALVLLIITNGIWGLAAIAAGWALLHFGKVKVSSPTDRGKKTAPGTPDAAREPAEATEAAKGISGVAA